MNVYNKHATHSRKLKLTKIALYLIQKTPKRLAF